MNELERRLRDELAALLDIAPEHLSTTTPFDELGVDSLIGLRFARKLEDISGVEVDFEWLYDYPTLAQLARFLESLQSQPAA